jgi:hypothetical protein
VQQQDIVRYCAKNIKTLAPKAFTPTHGCDSIFCYRDSGKRQRKLLKKRNHSERKSQKDKPHRNEPKSESSEEDTEERYLDEIDRRRSFRSIEK